MITDASDLSVARALGVNYTPKLANLVGTAAVQASRSRIGRGGGVVFPAPVDFSPTHILTPSATGFPPAAAQAGTGGEAGYSPDVEVRFRGREVVLDAPHVATVPTKPTVSSR